MRYVVILNLLFQVFEHLIPLTGNLVNLAQSLFNLSHEFAHLLPLGIICVCFPNIKQIGGTPTDCARKHSLEL